jgi:hypothetical protein
MRVSEGERGHPAPAQYASVADGNPGTASTLAPGSQQRRRGLLAVLRAQSWRACQSALVIPLPSAP